MGPGSRSARRAQGTGHQPDPSEGERAGTSTSGCGPAADRPVGVDIRPARWVAAASVAGAALGGGLGVLGGIGWLVHGDLVNAAATFVPGLVFAVLVFDVAGRRAATDGDRLVLQQWYREVVVHRDELDRFEASRASLFRWDIVAERREPKGGRRLVRLWATRTITAGRRTRQGWLDDLERWLTSGSSPDDLR